MSGNYNAPALGFFDEPKGIIIESGSEMESYFGACIVLNRFGIQTNLTGPPVPDSGVRIDENFAVFGCKDGTVVITDNHGHAEYSFSPSVQDLFINRRPAWFEVLTGLDGHYSLAVNSLGVGVVAGWINVTTRIVGLLSPAQQNGMGIAPDDGIVKRVAFSLSKGQTWVLHPHAGDVLDKWRLVGHALWFTPERLCFGVGHANTHLGAGCLRPVGC